tara:strand:- start:1584 stop:2309 length:726 start_codon:yes stop_codon:yes gene_type:complete
MVKKDNNKILLTKNIVEDTWLKNIYKKNCYIVKNEKYIQFFKDYKNSFFFLKTLKKIKQNYLFEKKLKFIGTNITFQKNIKLENRYKKKKDINYKFKVDNSAKKKVLNIAYKNFKFSRFNIDTRLPPSKSNLIKKKTVENYFHGLRGDKIYIQFYKKKISGFCLLIFNNNLARIDLICIDKKFSNKGLAKDMIRYVLGNMKKFNKKKLVVSTQTNNIAAVKLYESLKFVPKGILYLYHYIS